MGNELFAIACRQCWADDLIHCLQCGEGWCPTCGDPCDCEGDDDDTANQG